MPQKRILKKAKLQFKGSQAKPGAELASVGINMPKFCTEFNEATKERSGETVPVLITVFEDKSFQFELKTTPASDLIFKYANIKKGSSNPSKEKVGKISLNDIEKIAKYKMKDLNTNNLTNAIKIISGSAKSLGVEVITDGLSNNGKNESPDPIKIQGENETKGSDNE